MTAILNVARGLVSVTPSGVDLRPSGLAVFAAVAGDLEIEDSLGNINVIPVAAGQIIQCRIKKIIDTNTTATGIFMYVND